MIGLFVGLAVSLLAGSLNPGYEPSLEVEARGGADVLDLGVAILSGFVAAHVPGQPGVVNTLAGVAIAGGARDSGPENHHCPPRRPSRNALVGKPLSRYRNGYFECGIN